MIATENLTFLIIIITIIIKIMIVIVIHMVYQLKFFFTTDCFLSSLSYESLPHFHDKIFDATKIERGVKVLYLTILRVSGDSYIQKIMKEAEN